MKVKTRLALLLLCVAFILDFCCIYNINLYAKTSKTNDIVINNPMSYAKAKKKTTKKKKKKSKRSYTKKVNKTVSCPDWKITIVKYGVKKRGVRLDSFTKVGEPEIIGLIVKAKNTSGKTKTFYTRDIEIINSSKEILSPDILSMHVWGKYTLFDSPKLQNGGSSTGYIQYSNTNQKNNNLKVRINCNNGGLFKKDKIITVDLP